MSLWLVETNQRKGEERELKKVRIRNNETN